MSFFEHKNGFNNKETFIECLIYNFHIKAWHQNHKTNYKNKNTLINKTLQYYLIIDKLKIHTIWTVDVLLLKHARIEKTEIVPQWNI